MKKLILGPTFSIDVADTPEVVADRLGAWVVSAECLFVGSRQGLHLQLTIPRRDRHRWSPWLTLEVSEAGGAGSVVFGRFNPSPAIWTGYMMFSLTLITIGTGAVMWAMAQWVMKNPPTALWGVPICLIVLGVMWGFSAAGQRLAGDEMRRMREGVEGIVGRVGRD